MIADRDINLHKFKEFINAAASFFEPQVQGIGISLNAYAEKLAQKGTIAYFEEDGTILGAVIGYTHDTPDNTSYITQVYVLPECRGRGLSKVLLEEYCLYCLTSGLDHVWLTTRKNNFTAQKAYEKAGFICIGECSEQMIKYIKYL